MIALNIFSAVTTNTESSVFKSRDGMVNCIVLSVALFFLTHFNNLLFFAQARILNHPHKLESLLQWTASL